MIKNVAKYNHENIAYKEFTTELKGYKIEDVDQFLDEIQQDYLVFNEQIQSLTDELFNVKKTLLKTEDKLEKLSYECELLDSNRVKNAKESIANSDVIARISHIEVTLKEIASKLNK